MQLAGTSLLVPLTTKDMERPRADEEDEEVSKVLRDAGDPVVAPFELEEPPDFFVPLDLLDLVVP